MAWSHLNRRHYQSTEPHKNPVHGAKPGDRKLRKCIKCGLEPRNRTSEDEVQNPHAVHVACYDEGLTGRTTFTAMPSKYVFKFLAIVAKPEAAILC